MTNHLLRRLQALFGTLGQLARAPVATALTLAVLGVTLALPTTLYVALDNLGRLGRRHAASGHFRGCFS